MKQEKPTHSAWKDFLYNTNDLLITIVILLVALLVIAWRVNVIMAYPKHLNTSHTQTASEVKKDAKAAESEDSKDSAQDSQKAKKDTKKSEEKSDSKSEKSGKSEVKATYSNGRLTKTMKIEIEQGSLTSAMDQLVDMGLYTSHRQFKRYCHNQGLKAGDIKAGKHTLKKGWSKAKIARMLTR